MMRTAALVLLCLAPLSFANQAVADSATSSSRYRLFDAMVDSFEEYRCYHVKLDLKTQRLALDVPEDRVYGYHAGGAEAPLDTSPDVFRNRFVSAAVLAQKAKQFDDGLYAAVELAAQKGAGLHPGKKELLKALLSALADSSSGEAEEAQEVLFAAAMLGKLRVKLPPLLEGSVRTRTQAFLQEPRALKPMGFYTWTEELTRIFRQDRMLQEKWEDEESIEAVLKVLHQNENARQTYTRHLALLERLTNPFPPEYLDLREGLLALDEGRLIVPEGGVFFFPPSQSYEGELVKKLYGNRSIPEDFNLMEEMVRRIRKGKIGLEPKPESGWYDYQVWALEPLLLPKKTPEGKRLRLSESYCQHLEELFKGVLALSRETHMRQLEMMECGASREPPRIHIYPELSAEPLATHYLRRALGYRFIREILEKAFGPGTLEGIHRLRPEGRVMTNLAWELAWMEGLFHGAYLTVNRELGVEPKTNYQVGSGKGEQADMECFREWKESTELDVDIERDCRMMVPLFYDIEREKTKVWVFLGWAQRRIEISFAKEPKVEVVGETGTEPKPEIEFESITKKVHYPVTAEMYVTKLLDRDEFQEHCDTYKTQTKILENLR